MTVSANDGPLVTKGVEASIGNATDVSGTGIGGPPYVSGGTSTNPDAGPNCFFAGNMFKDMRYRYSGGGGALVVGGYQNQAVGFLDNNMQTIDLVPSTLAVANIAAAQVAAAGVGLTLVAVAGAGITILADDFDVLATGLTVPEGALQIDAAPTWEGYGTSGAMQGWSGAACGRAVSVTAAAGAAGGVVRIVGYDVYGVPTTEDITAVANETTAGQKGFVWVVSVTPQFTDAANNYSVGTADVFEFPLRADRFSDTTIWWDEGLIVANTGFVSADTATATATTNSVRGSYATQSASNGARRLRVMQRVRPALVDSQVGCFGVTNYPGV